MTVKVTRDKLKHTAADVIDLVLRKNTDYGDAWQRHGIASVLVRLSDKALRLEKLSDGSTALIADEQWADTLRDIAGYSLLGLLLEELSGREKDMAVDFADLKEWLRERGRVGKIELRIICELDKAYFIPWDELASGQLAVLEDRATNCDGTGEFGWWCIDCRFSREGAAVA